LTTTLHQCSCPHCSSALEYDGAYSGQVIDCPCCQKPLTLPEKPFEPEKSGVVTSLFNKLKQVRQTAQEKSILKQKILDAVSDGVLTTEELAQIRAFMSETGLPESEVEDWSREIFVKAVESLDVYGVSLARISSIEAIAVTLGLNLGKIRNEQRRIEHFRRIAQIREGDMPRLTIPNVLFQSGEEAHWCEPARLWEYKVVGRRYEGGSRGISFRVAKGVSLRLGASRGQMVTDSADVPVCDGNFIITNRRLIFQGEGKSFDTKFDKIIDMTNHADGIRYSEKNRQKPRKIQYFAPNGEIIIEVLNRVFSGET
jgi:hypothetical protein